MKLYRYSESGSLVGWVDIERQDAAPYLAQGGYTDSPPPGEGGAWKFVDGQWLAAADLRGTLWHDPATLQTLVITEVDQHAPQGWVQGLPAPGLSEHKAAQWAQVRAARKRAEFGGFTWDGSRFDSDHISQTRITGAAVLAMVAQQSGAPFSEVWTLADNSARVLNAADMIAVGVALGQHVVGVHATAAALRSQIDAASVAIELEAITWPPP